MAAVSERRLIQRRPSMTDQGVYRLLLECGFRPSLFAPPFGHVWRLIGELDGNFAVTVGCTARRRDHFTLEVASDETRHWLREMLAQNGAPDVNNLDIQLISNPRSKERSSRWIPVAIGAGAAALFGWVISTIAFQR
jgi:hypothetical protein